MIGAINTKDRGDVILYLGINDARLRMLDQLAGILAWSEKLLDLKCMWI